MIAFRRSAFPSTSFRSVFLRLAMPSRTRNMVNPKSKPNDHRLPRPSGAAKSARRKPRAGFGFSVDPPDRRRRQPRFLVRRRQADAAGFKAAERYARPPEMDGRTEHRASGGWRLAR